MNLNKILFRNLDSNEWALALFLLALFVLALVKTSSEKRFVEFFRLAISNKYIKIYRDSSYLMTRFTIVLFFVNLLSISFLIHLTSTHFGYNSSDFDYHFIKNDWILFIRTFILLTVFVLIKYLLEKIVVTLFGIEEVADHFNLEKISYKSFTGILFLPIALILFYNNSASDTTFYIVIGAFATINVFFYLVLLQSFQKLIIGKLFYFILYLCTFEIGPYYFIYYLIKKN